MATHVYDLAASDGCGTKVMWQMRKVCGANALPQAHVHQPHTDLYSHAHRRQQCYKKRVKAAISRLICHDNFHYPTQTHTHT